MINYICPKCKSIMICVSTASIPPIITYQCYSCGYTSNPIKEEYNCKILPKGKWIDTGEKMESYGKWYRCSNCENTNYYGNFCPNCGAKMKD